MITFLFNCKFPFIFRSLSHHRIIVQGNFTPLNVKENQSLNCTQHGLQHQGKVSLNDLSSSQLLCLCKMCNFKVDFLS